MMFGNICCIVAFAFGLLVLATLGVDSFSDHGFRWRSSKGRLLRAEKEQQTDNLKTSIVDKFIKQLVLKANQNGAKMSNMADDKVDICGYEVGLSKKYITNYNGNLLHYDKISVHN